MVQWANLLLQAVYTSLFFYFISLLIRKFIGSEGERPEGAASEGEPIAWFKVQEVRGFPSIGLLTSRLAKAILLPFALPIDCLAATSQRLVLP